MPTSLQVIYQVDDPQMIDNIHT